MIPMASSYADFIAKKSQSESMSGFAPNWMPDFLFDFQLALTDWAIRKGRAAIFADCGMGKTPMQLVWAHNVTQHTNRPVLILTPLAVGAQTVEEGSRFGIPCVRSRDGQFADARIVVTNYEKLHLFNPDEFAGVVADESSCLKHFTGATQKAVTQFMRKAPYRLLCTATAAPNDYTELGTSSEALGELGMVDMLSRFFKQDDRPVHQLHRLKHGVDAASVGHAVAGTGGGWRLKGHAVQPFWRWVASWARACRKPSDLGFDDAALTLPPLLEREHVVIPNKPQDGMLFVRPAVGLKEERDERRRTLDERIALVARLVDHSQPAVVWCHLNAEGDALEKAIPKSLQVSGSDSDEAKELAYRSFANGGIRVLITKPKIGAFGLNWQHCAHVVTFASHSYEQYYQSIRRCWRFGQTQSVHVDIISTEGEQHVRKSMARKSAAAEQMFTQLVANMNQSLAVERVRTGTTRVETPAWL